MDITPNLKKNNVLHSPKINQRVFLKRNRQEIISSPEQIVIECDSDYRDSTTF